MYVFAIAALFGLGVMALTGCVDRFLAVAREYRAVAMVVLGVLGAWLADFSLFERWGTPVREEWIGILVSGLAIGGLAHLWHEAFEFLSGLTRKTNDEADALEKTSGLKAA